MPEDDKLGADPLRRICQCRVCGVLFEAGRVELACPQCAERLYAEAEASGMVPVRDAEGVPRSELPRPPQKPQGNLPPYLTRLRPGERRTHSDKVARRRVMGESDDA